MILTNARVMLPDGIRDRAEIVTRDGKIVEIRDASSPPSSEAIDVHGDYLAPGFIDLHMHGAVGRDTMEGTPEALRAICEFHASGGTTSLLLTTATAPLRDITHALDAIRAAMNALPQVAGAHVEGPFISRAKAGAQRAEFIREPEAASVAELLRYNDVIKRITIAPEIGDALECIRAFAARGIAVSAGHSDAWDEEARAGLDAGVRHTTHTFNCMSSARRRDRQRVAGLLEFALSEPAIVCELIADGHHVSTTLMKMLYRAKRSAGICLVTDATAGAGLADGATFRLAGVECVVEDDACWLADRSALAGSAARMIDCVRTMVHDVGAPFEEAIAMATQNPARAVGLTNKGEIRPGADADLVVLSPELQVQKTFIAGAEIFSTA